MINNYFTHKRCTVLALKTGGTRLRTANIFCRRSGRYSANSATAPAHPGCTRRPTTCPSIRRTCRRPQRPTKRTPCWVPVTSVSYLAARTTRLARQRPCPIRTCTTETVMDDHTGTFRGIE